MGIWTRPDLPARWSSGDQPTFVGRLREGGAIESAWEAASGGARQLMFVGGDPGAGKSRLVAESCVELHRRGATVLVGSCVAEFGPAYQPFIEPVDALTIALADGSIQLSTREEPELDKVLLRLETVSCSDGTPADILPPQAHEYQRELYDAVVAVSRAAADQAGPLVMVLEDLHWAGETALQMLTYIVERASESRLLVLATHRTTAADRSEPLTAALAELVRVDGVHRIDLQGLNEAEVIEYVSAEAGVPTAAARSAAHLIHARTGGNPFFLRELWRDVCARGGIASMRDDDFVAPASVRDVVRTRMDRLTPPQRLIVELAAIIGDDFDTATLLAVATSTAEEALSALDEAASLGILEPGVEPDDELRFPHALMRRAVLDVIPRSRLTQGHARVAEALERSSAAHLRVQRMAHHYASASGLGYTDKAVRYLIEAADIAGRSLAHADAASLLERAASLTVDSGQRDELLLSAAKRYILAANFSTAMTLSEAVATSASGVVQLRAAITYEVAAWHPGRPGHRAAELLTHAMRTATEATTDRTTFTRGLASLGRALGYAGAAADAGALGDRALELAVSSGDEGLLADALQASLQHPFHASDLETRRSRADELFDIAARTGDMDHLTIAAFWRATVAYMTGDAEALAASHSDLARAADVTGQSFWHWITGCITQGRQFLAGDLVEAENTCTNLVALGASFGADDTEGPFGIQMYMLNRESGGIERVRGLITGNESLSGRWLPGLLAVYTELGLEEAVSRLLLRIREHGLLRYTGSADWPGILAFLVEAAIFVEDADAAQEFRPLLAEYEGLNLIVGPFVALFGSADRYLGLIDELLVRGDPVASYDRAIDMEQRVGSPLHHAYGVAARANCRRRLGTTQAEDVVGIAKATAWAAQIGARRVLRQLGAASAPPPPLGSVLSRPDPAAVRVRGLTSRESEVLWHVASGLSNREIAKRLFISESTAANHVRSILMKTGCANRTQAALYAAEQIQPGLRSATPD